MSGILSEDGGANSRLGKTCQETEGVGNSSQLQLDAGGIEIAYRSSGIEIPIDLFSEKHALLDFAIIFHVGIYSVCSTQFWSLVST